MTAMPRSERMPQCPNVVPGATTVVREVPDGIELRITAAGTASAEIRRLAAFLVGRAEETRGRHRANGGGEGRFGRCPVVMRNTRLEARDIPDGAAVTLRPSTPAELDWLRSEVESRSAELDAPKAFGAGAMRNCPSAAPNAQTTMRDTPLGVEVAVTGTTADTVEDIRRRGRALAAMPPIAPSRCPITPPGAKISATETSNGVTLTVQSGRPEDVDALRQVMRDRARRFAPPILPESR
jgi:hypothetical protein